MTKLKYLRRKRAKGREYYYFDAGAAQDGTRILTPLPHIRDPRFGGCYAAAVGQRTKAKNRPGILTLDGLIRSYEKSPEFRGLSESTKRSYTLYLKRANTLMRSAKGASPAAKDVDRKDVLTLRDRLSDTPGAANQAIRSLGALFAWAMDNEKAKDNPAKLVRKYKAKPHEKWPEELLEEALADPQVGDPVALFFFTGQRIGDVIAMRWDDVRGDTMRVWQRKKDKQIQVAILPELAERLKRLERKATTILTNANGRPWSQSGLRQKLQEWAKERGHKVVPHGLRKNAVDALLTAGCTGAEVSGITDQSIQMVEHYARGVNKLTLGRAAVVKLEAARRARNKGGM